MWSRLYDEGVADGTWVEVMRVARRELKLRHSPGACEVAQGAPAAISFHYSTAPSLYPRRPAAALSLPTPRVTTLSRRTTPTVWFFLAAGSGIWWNTGRSLRLSDIGSFSGCHDAAARGFETVQLRRSFRGYSYELIDCRGVGARGANSVCVDMPVPAAYHCRPGNVAPATA